MSQLILSVCPQGAKSKDGTYSQFSLRIDTPPNCNLVKQLFINLTGIDIEITNHLTYINHGRIISKEINEWIIFNQLHRYFKNQPTRLIFTFSELKVGAVHRCTLYQPQGL